jgi:hypothetical protein
MYGYTIYRCFRGKTSYRSSAAMLNPICESSGTRYCRGSTAPIWVFMCSYIYICMLLFRISVLLRILIWENQTLILKWSNICMVCSLPQKLSVACIWKSRIIGHFLWQEAYVTTWKLTLMRNAPGYLIPALNSYPFIPPGVYWYGTINTIQWKFGRVTVFLKQKSTNSKAKIANQQCFRGKNI